MVNFSDVVDLDDEAFEDRVSSDYVGRFNNSDGFKLFMTIVIVVSERNLKVIGIGDRLMQF